MLFLQKRRKILCQLTVIQFITHQLTKTLLTLVEPAVVVAVQYEKELKNDLNEAYRLNSNKFKIFQVQEKRIFLNLLHWKNKYVLHSFFFYTDKSEQLATFYGFYISQFEKFVLLAVLFGSLANGQ